MNTPSQAHHHHKAGQAGTVPDPHPGRAAELGRLRFLATKVAMVHGRAHPAMATLSEIVTRVAESPLRPITSVDRSALGFLTTGYVPWPDACDSVRALFAGLRQLPDAGV